VGAIKLANPAAIAAAKTGLGESADYVNSVHLTQENSNLTR